MKRCPTCKRSYDDNTLSFCLDDGTPLIADSPSNRNLQETLVSPPPSIPASAGGSGMPGAPFYNPPQAQPFAPATKNRKTWPWVVGILALLFVVIMVVAVIAVLPAMMRNVTNDNRPQPTPTPGQPTPTPGSEDESDVPTDKDEVLAQLSKIEDDWERANVKGDKEALERILAEEYRGDSKSKQQYIDSLKPNTDIQSWDIQNLTVDQNGGRATVNGRLKLETKTGTESYDFTDEYVWRDHRWQAVSAHSSSVK